MTNLKKDTLLDIADAHTDPLSEEERQKFPPMKCNSARDEVIMCCIVAGLSQYKIAESFGIAQPTVWKIIKRLDPSGMYKRDKNAKKAMLAGMALQSAAGMQNFITEEKLEDSSAKDLVGMTKQYVDIANNLSESKHKTVGAGRMDAMLEEMEEASVEEVDE